MVKWPKMIGLALLAGGTLVLGPARELPAATSASSDTLLQAADNPTLDIGSIKPLKNGNRDEGRPLPGGNPLWSVPLSALTAMRERPIFSASRRPPARAVAAAPADQVHAPAPEVAAPPDRPALALIGVVIGEGDAIAVFLDATSKKIVRLRQGEIHSGWVLGSVLPRDVTLRKADRSEVLSLPRADGPAGVAATPAAPGLLLPASSAAETSFAPFTPRSTPKNGEPDGL
jgi:general secretion pathway protein N